MKTLLDLADRMEEVADNIEKQASECAVMAALTIVRDLVYVTPVDTSRALSNWRVRLGQPYKNVIGPLYPGERGSTRNASAAEAIAIATNLLKNKKPGQSIWIANNTPYIMDLNNGTSRQNPGGFIERADALGRRVVSNFKFKL